MGPTRDKYGVKTSGAQNLDAAEVRKLGEQCAESGGQCFDNPFSESEHGFAWFEGFLASRVPNPACPWCHGSGLLTFRSVGEESNDSSPLNLQTDCPCNDPDRDDGASTQ